MDSLQGESNLEVENSDAPVGGAGAGSTKRKELHGTTAVRALSGSWMDNPQGVMFHACKVDFTCDVAKDFYPGFVLLTEDKLDNDVANTKVDLYLLDKMVNSAVKPCGEVQLSSDQIRRAMRFHELLFNGLFGKLFKGSKASGTPREFLLQRETDCSILWNPSYMYLILPLESQNSLEDLLSINWRAIDSCVSVIEFMKDNCWLSSELSERKNQMVVGGLSPTEGSSNAVDTMYLANSSLPVGELKDTVVMAIHTGRIYYVIESLANTSAESPFVGNADGKPVKYSSFSDYFNKKYGIVLNYPGQPLFLLKQTHNPFNLLIDNESSASRRKMLSNGKEMAAEKPQNHVHMPPELLVRVDIPLSVLRAFYLIPSLMQRLESMMLACQLREDIRFNLSGFGIPCSLILEALTTLRCCEDFSSERLELLGDSVLKYAVSCHLFLKYPEQHEGELSNERQRAVCNATLHGLGTSCRLQEYIRDTAFEPRRWVAPGQLSVHPVPCSHGIDTTEVPLDSRYHTIDENIIVGKSCDNGHRWLVSKSIADCVEALIGAYYIGGGLVAALHIMKWLGIEAELEPSYIDKAIQLASDRSYYEKANEIVSLESKLGYEFSTKGLLLEAITYAAEQEVGLGYCYERLEFLGDAVLDFLLTWYLYQNHTDIDPGELTDLRSASVNNENFAQISVRRNLYPYLQNCSTSLLNRITEYVQLVMDAEDVKTLLGRQFPKELGDLFESIAGAILIDTKLDVKEVWRIFEPLLSPIVTPDNLELPPFRELIELCDCLGYFFKECCVNEGGVVLAELKLQLKDVLLIGEGIGRTGKGAKGQAALHLLKDLESRGISYVRCVSRRRKRDLHDDVSSSHDSIVPASHKKQKACLLLPGSVGGPGVGTPVIAAINTQKGGPRTSLYDLCKRLQWPMPSFETTEHKLKSPIEFGEGSNRKQGFNSYASKISLHIPDFGVVQAMGDQRADKKSSQDSATLCLLYKLEELGKLVIGCS